MFAGGQHCGVSTSRRARGPDKRARSPASRENMLPGSASESSGFDEHRCNRRMLMWLSRIEVVLSGSSYGCLPNSELWEAKPTQIIGRPRIRTSPPLIDLKRVPHRDLSPPSVYPAHDGRVCVDGHGGMREASNDGFKFKVPASCHQGPEVHFDLAPGQTPPRLPRRRPAPQPTRAPTTCWGRLTSTATRLACNLRLTARLRGTRLARRGCEGACACDCGSPRFLGASLGLRLPSPRLASSLARPRLRLRLACGSPRPRFACCSPASPSSAQRPA